MRDTSTETPALGPPIAEPLSHLDVVLEANRCLYCYDAPCIAACPTGIDIPTFIKKIATGNLLGTLMAFNKLTMISGYFSFLNRFAL